MHWPFELERINFSVAGRAQAGGEIEPADQPADRVNTQQSTQTACRWQTGRSLSAANNGNSHAGGQPSSLTGPRMHALMILIARSITRRKKEAGRSPIHLLFLPMPATCVPGLCQPTTHGHVSVSSPSSVRRARNVWSRSTSRDEGSHGPLQSNSLF